MKETPILLVRQRHEAKKAGLHYDLRVVIGDKAYSWATKKEMPVPGKPILLFEQPVHDRAYATSKHIVIPDGQYGAGETFLDFAQKGKAQIHDDAYHLDLNNGDRYLIKKMPDNKYGDKAWLFLKKKEPSVDNPYLTKAAGLYDDLVSHRSALESEARQIYHKDWSGDVPRTLWEKAHNQARADASVDEDGEVHVPDINPYIQRLMRNRHVSAGLEESYGHEVVNHADTLAHNNAGIKSIGAALAVGATGGIASLALSNLLSHNPKLATMAAVGGGVASAVGALAAAGKVYGNATEKGRVDANEYLKNKPNPYAERAKNFI